MIVKIAKRRRDYAQISNRALRDKRLSWQARGVLAYLLSHDEDWQVRFEHLHLQSPKAAKKGIRRIFRELRRLGYAKLVSVKGNCGQWIGKQYAIHEEPAVTDEKGLDGPPSELPDRRRSGTRRLSVRRLNQSLKKTNSAESKIRRNGSASFFHTNGEVSPFIAKCSAKLEEHVRKSRKINPRFKRQKWHDQFSMLLVELEGDKARLKAVLKAYLTEAHDKFTPQADSAESFRKKFVKIERWVKRVNGMDDEDQFEVAPRIKVVIED